MPLLPPLPPAEPYPINALGPVLARAAIAIASKIQVPEATAAQSVLATAALAAQAHVDVLMPFGQTRPTSLYCATVAGSSDRKTSADREALWPARHREKALREIEKLEQQKGSCYTSATHCYTSRHGLTFRRGVTQERG